MHIFIGDAMNMGYDNEAKELKVSAASNVLKYVSGLRVDEKKKAFVMNGVLENAKPAASADVQAQNMSAIDPAGVVQFLGPGELITAADADVQTQNLAVIGQGDDVPIREVYNWSLPVGVDREALGIDPDLYLSYVPDNKEEILKPDNTWKDVRSYNLKGGNSRLFGFDKNGEGFKLENYHKGDLSEKDTSSSLEVKAPSSTDNIIFAD